MRRSVRDGCVLDLDVANDVVGYISSTTHYVFSVLLLAAYYFFGGDGNGYDNQRLRAARTCE